MKATNANFRAWSHFACVGLLLTIGSSLETARRAPVVEGRLHFEKNLGQWDSQVQFLARADGYRSVLSAGQNVMQFSTGATAETIAMRLVGADLSSTGEPLDRQKSFSAYFIGDDPTRWRGHVPHYAKIRYRSVYPGIDLVYYGHDRKLEYDFVVHPGADPDQIQVSFAGPTNVTLAANGDLLLATKLGDVRQRKPRVYQVVGGRTFEVDASHRIEGQSVAFSVGAYDASYDLVVDPVIEWSTNFGGAVAHSPDPIDYGPDDRILAMSVSPDKSVYVAGETTSIDFPLQNSIDSEIGQVEAFVAKFVPDPVNGSVSLAWSTYLGGSQTDRLFDIVARSGAIYTIGQSHSSDFPTVNQFQEFQTGQSQPRDAVVSKLQEAGDQISLVWSTFLGGTDGDLGVAIAVDSTDHVYVTGITISTDFPTINAFQGAQGDTDIFLTKFNPLTGTNLTAAYSTYFGGSGDDGSADIQVDAAGAVYIAGGTRSVDFPTLHTIQERASTDDAFVAKFGPRQVPAVALEWSSYLGGNDSDGVSALVVDSSGAVFVTGLTRSTNFPIVNAYQSTAQGLTDVFVSRINQTAPLTLGWSTYYGAEGFDQARDIALDRSGAVYVTGITTSVHLPQVDQAQPFQGGIDAFVARFVIGAGGGPDLKGSTFLGGPGIDGSVDYGGTPALGLDAETGIYLAGSTSSPDFPLLNQYATYAGGVDGFITKLRNDPVG